MTCDIIIHGGYVVTMQGLGTGIIPNGAVAVKGNKIQAVGNTAEIMKAYSAHRYIDAKGKAILPGLIDCHMHTSNAIAKGAAQDLKEGQWMFYGILPVLSCATDEDLRRGSMLNILDSLLSGTTTFCDYDIPMLEIVKNHIQLKTRAIVSDLINEMPSDTTGVVPSKPYDFDYARGAAKLAANEKLVNEYHMSNNGRIMCRYGPQAADMCSVEYLKEVKRLADRDKVGIYIHVEQMADEQLQTEARTGKRPVDLLNELGYFGPDTMVAHMTFSTPREVEIVAKSGASLAVCPGNGTFPPGELFRSFGGRIALGSDQAPINCRNMFGVMKLAAERQKYCTKDPAAWPAWQVLRFATIESARALNVDHLIGSLEVGKLADIIIIDLNTPSLAPIYEFPIRNIIPNLVYGARGNEVETVIIDGNVVVDERKVIGVDVAEEIRLANESAKRFSDEIAKKPWAASLPLSVYTAEGKY